MNDRKSTPCRIRYASGMYRMPHLWFLWVFIVTLFGCENEYDESIAEPIFSESTLYDWRYKTTDTGDRLQIDWERENFGSATIRYQRIKAMDEVKDWKKAFYRFLIEEQTYATPDLARERIERIGEHPPGQHTKAYPQWTLCEGYFTGKRAFIVSTDSTRFAHEELPSILLLIEDYFETKAGMPINRVEKTR
jgi:hypothetical protein